MSSAAINTLLAGAAADGWIEQNVRASSIKDALDCAMRFEAKHILGIRMPSAGIAHLGTALHKGTAAYDQSVIDRKTISVDDAAGAFVDALNGPPSEPTDEGVNWTEDLLLKEAEAVGIKIISNYVDRIGSKRVYSAVECKLEAFPIQFPAQKVLIRLTGTTDRVRKIAGHGHGISDVKSGKTRCTKEGKVQSNAEKAQLAVYELIAEKNQGIEITEPAEIIGASTAHGTVGTLTVPGTRAALVGTAETPGVLDFIAKMLRSGVFPPNPSSNLCSPKFCPIFKRCPYHD